VGDDGCFYENQYPLAMPESELACGLFEFTKDMPDVTELTNQEP
jgi:hypothetical protein